MGTELLVIFPENKTSPVQTCDFTENAEGWNEEEFRECFGLIMGLKQTFQYERFVVFYDLNNVQAFCYPHLNHRHSLFNKRYVMLTLLKGMQNWRSQSEQQGESCMLHGMSLNSNSISEVAVRKYNRPDDSFSLVDCMALLPGCTPIVVVVNGNDVPVNVLGLDEDDFFNWLCNNRKPAREYSWNPKHGENGKGNWPGESRLLGSRKEAKLLLKNAVGETYRGTLFCWDAQYGHYMEYKKELNDTYHSFHLEGEDVRRIPASVKRFIDKLQKRQS